jgi:hypothetical protein
VSQLQDMGFSEAQSLRALRATGSMPRAGAGEGARAGAGAGGAGIEAAVQVRSSVARRGAAMTLLDYH